MLTAIRKHKALFTLGLAILILLLVMRKAVAATLVPVLAAAVFAGLFAPLAAWLQKKCSSGAAALLTLLPELLRGLSNYRMLIYAVLLIAMMLFNNSSLKKRMLEKRGMKQMEKLEKTAKSGKEGA